MFTAVRNEAPFLLEWIAYHQVIGFERFIVFSNPSDDGTDEILDALVDTGIIENHKHTPPVGTGAQPNAARIANKRQLLNHNDWVIWLDLDEFLVVNVGDGYLTDLLEAIEGKQGLLIPWRLFGDSGNDRFGGRFVSNDFTYATHPWGPKNRQIKTLFRCQPGMNQLGVGGIHRPKIDAPDSFTSADFVMANGNCIDGNDKRHGAWLRGRDSGSNAWIHPKELGVKLAQINHYSVRTPEHFLLKRLRGDGYFSSESNSERAKRSAGLYKNFNTNIAKDTRILKFEGDVTRAIERLMSLPQVAAAHTRGLVTVRKRISQIPDEDLAELNKLRFFGRTDEQGS